MKPLPRQLEAYKYLRDNETTRLGFGGSAGGGKSWLGSEWLMQCGYHLPGTRWYVGRDQLKDTRESVLITWGKVAKAHNFTAYKPYEHGIRFNNGSEIVFLDLSFYPVKDPYFERLGSKEFTGGWIEEAGQVHSLAADVMKSRVGRHLNKELGILPKTLYTFNPKKNWLYTDFYLPWKSGQPLPKTAFVQSLPRDNDRLPPEYMESLMSIKDESMRKRLLEGLWEYDDDPTALIGYENIVNIFNNSHVIPGHDKYITADIATFGSDLFVIMVWYGWVVVEIVAVEKNDGAQVVELINAARVRHGVKPGNIVFDADGVGAGVTGHIRGARQFNNGSAPFKYKGKVENYINLKTQCYYHLAEYINEGQIHISADMSSKDQELLKQDLEYVKSDNSNDGKLRILPKQQIKVLMGRSPDFSDALAMRVYFTLDYPKALPSMLS